MIPGIVASQLIFGGGGTSLIGTASINFLTGVYTVEGASVTAADILDSPGAIDGSGLLIGFGGIPNEILSPLLDILLEPTWTLVLEIGVTSVAGNVWLMSFAQMPVGGTNDTMQIGIGDVGFSDEIFVYDDNGSGGSRQVSSGATTALGVHRIAISRENTRLSMSIDGDPFVTDTTDEPIPLFTAVTFGNFSDDTNGQAAYIRTFDVMAIQPDNVLESLSALSGEEGNAVGHAAGIGSALAISSTGSRVGVAAGIGSAVAASVQIRATDGIAAGIGSAVGAGQVVGDPNFANVVLLLGFNGTDGATSTTDESSAPHTMTFNGTAQIDTAQSKFGVSSLLLQGDGNFITSAHSTDWRLPGTFTIEGWFRYASASSSIQVIASHWNGASASAWIAYVLPDTTVQEARIQISTDGTNVAFSSPTATGVDTNYAPNTWFHFAWDRDASNVLRTYIDGVMTGKTTSASGMFTATSSFAIGGTASGNLGVTGWVDEFRLTKGVSRYGDTVGDSGFTPPSAAFPRS